VEVELKHSDFLKIECSDFKSERYFIREMAFVIEGQLMVEYELII